MLAADQKFLDGCDADVADLENGMWPEEAAQAARCAKRMMLSSDWCCCLCIDCIASDLVLLLLAVLDKYGIELGDVIGWHSDNCNGAVAVMHDELCYSSMQSVCMQSVCTCMQSVCTQSVCMQSVYMQSVCMQSVYMQPVYMQSVCVQ